VHPLGLLGHNSGVSLARSQGVSRHKLLVHAHPLLLIVGTPVSNNNLRGILVGHNNGSLGQSGSETGGVIGLQGLFEHASVKVVFRLESSPMQKQLK
jgi:hypothetical protein